MILKFIKIEYFNKIIEYGLYLVVFFISIQTRWIVKEGDINGGYSEYLTMSLYAIDILLIIIILLNCYISIRRLAIFKNVSFCKVIKQKYYLFILVFDLIIFISIFFASNKILAFHRYIVFLLGVGLFWLIVSAKYDKIKLIWFFLIGVFLQASFGIYQFLTQSTFVNKWLGMSSHDPSELGVSVVEAIGKSGIGERWLRSYGGMDHPNILGGLLVIGILFSIFLIINNQQKIQYSKYLYLLFVAFCSLFFITLFFTFSRLAWLSLFVSIFIMLIIVVIKKDWFKQKNILEIILVFSILSFFLFSQNENLVKVRLFGNNRLNDKSINERILYISEAKKIIKDNWLFGVGIGNYVNELANQNFKNSEKLIFGKKIKKLDSWEYQPVHNLFFLVWAEIGIFGLLSLLIFLGYFGWISFVGAVKKNNYICLPLFLVLVIMIMLDHWLWSLHFGVLFFWFVLGSIVIMQDFKKDSFKY